MHCRMDVQQRIRPLFARAFANCWEEGVITSRPCLGRHILTCFQILADFYSNIYSAMTAISTVTLIGQGNNKNVQSCWPTLFVPAMDGPMLQEQLASCQGLFGGGMI